MSLQQNLKQPQFSYDRAHVRLTYQPQDGFHTILINIQDNLVNRILFVSNEEALNHLHNLELALNLGAKFNEEGYWKFELPPKQRAAAEKEYYRKAKL